MDAMYLLVICYMISIFLLAWWLYQASYMNRRTCELANISTWVINLDKNKDRWNTLYKSYKASDLSAVKLNRFSAVQGNKVNLDEYVSQRALQDLILTERYGYRTNHTQLTKGAVGCYLSHVFLMYKLLASQQDMFIMLEDDIIIPKRCLKSVKHAIDKAPPDWDMLLLGYGRLSGTFYNRTYVRVDGMWGTHAYIINKKGARRFLENYKEDKVDAQIDMYMGYLSQSKKMNIYAMKPKIIGDPSWDDTDIQVDNDIITKPGENPFMYRSLIV